MSIAAGPLANDPVAVDRMAAPNRLSRTSVGAKHEFNLYFDAHESSGFNAAGQRRPYLSRITQLDYWTRARLAKAQLPLPSPTDSETLRAKYIGVFSLLAFCDRLEYFKDYFLTPAISDRSFPLSQPPAEWPRDAPITKDLFELIQEHQYRFFPLIFDRDYLHDRIIPPDQILPITELKILRSGEQGGAVVYKIRLDPAYNKLANKDAPIQDTFVLKVQSSESSHKNEVAAFTHFRSYPSPNVIGFYGSFIQNDCRCLLLEYVNGSNLLNYLERTPPPQTPSDRLQFWKSYCGYLKGLHGIHQIAQLPADGDFRGVHGDLKPENLLLKMGPSGNKYDFIPIITDFGCSDFRLVDTGGEDKRGLDRHGNQQYCAPEASHYTIFLERGPNRIDFAADIFSFGAITSEILVWIVFGHGGIVEYFKLRKQAMDQNDAFNGSGYAGCFHNGVDPWPEVGQMHQEVREALPTDDHITPKMIDLVEKRMLLGPSRNRDTAITLVKLFDNNYQEAKRLMCIGHSDSTCPTSPIRSNPPSPQASVPPMTPISSEQIHTTRDMNGHYRSMSNESSVGVISPVSSPSSLFSAPQRPESARTLDGVHDTNGQAVCAPSCDPPVRVRPGPTPLVTGVGMPNSMVESSISSALSPRTPVLPGRGQTTENDLLEVPGLNGHASGRTSTSSARKRPELKLGHLQQFWEYKKRIQSESSISPTLLEDVEYLQRVISGRDHIFYIDDSDSMAEFKPEVEKAFTLMSYVAKEVDQDGVELVFGSKPDKRSIHKRTSELSKRLRKQPFETPRDLMEHNFDHFVDKVLVPRLNRRSGPKKSLSVLVFTDGRWGDDTEKAAGVENPVRRLIEEIVKRRVGRTRVMISFVQFGDDPLGKQHLKYLDDFGKSLFKDEPHGNPFDIIDTGPISGNIYKLFVGSISQDVDDSDDDNNNDNG